MSDPVSAGCCAVFFTQLLGSLNSLCGGNSGGGPTSISVRCTNMFNNCICCQSCQWGQNTNIHQERTYSVADTDEGEPVRFSQLSHQHSRVPGGGQGVGNGQQYIHLQPRGSGCGSSEPIMPITDDSGSSNSSDSK